jgi:predicted MFS family arabinose efflux permease
MMMKRRLVLIACFLTVFTAYAVRYGYGVLLPEMLEPLHASKAQAGVIYSSFFIAYTISSPVLGLLGDRWNARWLLSSFVAILGCGAFFMSFATSITTASLVYILAGVGSSACWAPVMALAQRWTEPKNIGRTLAIIDIGSALGLIGAGAVMPLIVTAWDWQAGWMFLGGLGFIVAVLNFIVIRDRPAQEIDRPETRWERPLPVRVTVAGLLRDTKFWLFGIAYLLTGFAILIPFTFLSTYATQELDFSYEVAANLLTAIGIGAIISKVALGPLSDRVGRIKVMMFCAGLIAGGSLWMVFGRGIWLFVASLVFSLGYGVIWAMYAAAASDYFSRESAGTTIGLWTMFLGIGSVLAPIMSGWVADATGSLAWSFSLAAGAGLVSFLLLIPIRSPHEKI